MWMFEDDIVAHLASDFPGQVTRGLLALGGSDESIINFCLSGAELPGFGRDVLDRLSIQDVGLAEDVQMTLLRVVWQCDCIVPPLAEEEKTALAVAVLLQNADHRVAMEVALRAKIAEAPEEATVMLLREVARNDLTTAHQIRGGQYLVSWFLDGDAAVRAATVGELSQWPASKGHRAVVEYVLPQLTADEQHLLDVTDL